jgi:hypothetical protein
MRPVISSTFNNSIHVVLRSSTNAIGIPVRRSAHDHGTLLKSGGWPLDFVGD